MNEKIKTKKFLENLENFFLAKGIFLILFFSLALKIIFLLAYKYEVWWDSGVYIGMGKWIFSLGLKGLWEHIRPIVWPIVLGLFWKLGLDPVAIGRILMIFLSSALIYFTYILGKKFFNAKVALIAASLIAFSPIILFLSLHHYTEIPSALLVLISFIFAAKEKFFLSGAFLALAFLTKFPAGIFLLTIPILFLEKDFFYLKIKNKLKSLKFLKAFFKKFFLFFIGFFIIFAIYLISNFFAYGSFLKPLIDASRVVEEALGCPVLRAKPWWYYFYVLFRVEHFLYLLIPLGIFFAFKKSKNLTIPITVLAAFLLPLIYFMDLKCREYRYLTLFLPFAAFFVAKALAQIKKFWSFAFIFVSISSAIYGIYFYTTNQIPALPEISETYFNWFKNKDFKGEVWTSNPVHAAYSDLKFNKIYYPIYHKGAATNFNRYLFENSNRISAVALDNCGGGIICLENDSKCKAENEKTLKFLEANFNLALNLSQGRCWFKIFVK